VKAIREIERERADDHQNQNQDERNLCQLSAWPLLAQ
jgi:hypothetical protein